MAPTGNQRYIMDDYTLHPADAPQSHTSLYIGFTPPKTVRLFATLENGDPHPYRPRANPRVTVVIMVGAKQTGLTLVTPQAFSSGYASCIVDSCRQGRTSAVKVSVHPALFHCFALLWLAARI
ncbi:MAG: hypothetical protein H6668_02020 [Ardenticatenaceae bacterium]|nr:hypothetical protein [Ardenticatenaceae bacterium]